MEESIHIDIRIIWNHRKSTFESTLRRRKEKSLKYMKLEIHIILGLISHHLFLLDSKMCVNIQ